MSELARVMLAAPSSGAGKTTVTIGLLAALEAAGHTPTAFKCGPDYLDARFHRRCIDGAGGNLDLFFTSGQRARQLLVRGAQGCDIALLEGAMGFYDGVSGAGARASAYAVARVTQTPVVLVLDARGAALSLAATVQGFARFRADAGICGVILNGCTQRTCELVRADIERETGVRVLGYVPRDERFAFPSRHLGLVDADEVCDFGQRVDVLARTLAQTLDVPALVSIARGAPALDEQAFRTPELAGARGLRVGLARDAAFSFTYVENIRMLQDAGVELVEFSPLRDAALPEHLDGLLLFGGYPELHAEQLSANESMRESVRAAVEGGLVTVAECGGFMYLQQSIEDAGGRAWPMVGTLPGRCCDAGHLQHFGYAELETRRDTLLLRAGERVPVHEFHHWASDAEGDACLARKPRGTSWPCMVCTDTLQAGFAHLYYPAYPVMLKRFIEKMASGKERA